MAQDNDRTDILAANLKARIAIARMELQAQMIALGLHPKDGWRVREEIRPGESGTIILLRPIHITLDAPEIEVRVAIGEDGR